MVDHHPNKLALPRWTVIIYAVQFLLAVIVLGFDAYGIKYIPYNALIFSLVTALLTMAFCAYIIATTLALHNLYNKYAVLAMHVLMIIFWIVDLGLVANLAHLWSEGGSYYGYYWWSTCDNCDDYIKRDLGSLRKRDTTSTDTYRGVLIAGALFAAAEFVLWAFSGALVAMALNKHRSTLGSAEAPHTEGPPAYTGGQQAMPLQEQKFAHQQPEAQPLYQQPQQTQQPYPAQPQGQYTQQPVYNQQQQLAPGQYPQDPVSRQQTVSPVSQAGYSAPPQNTAELHTPQHTGAYNSNVSELSTQK